MSYLFKTIESESETTYELKTKNYYLFVGVVFLSVIPAAYIVDNYFSDNVNYFRIPYILLILTIYAILVGKREIKAVLRINKSRAGSLFSFKNPVKYTIKK